MTKKIIAISCVLVMLVIAITACRKKPETTEINGQEYVLVTDAEGNTMLSSDGLIRAYVLDEKGYPVTNTDGSYAEKLVTVVEDEIVGDKSVSTSEYSLTMPKGWETDNAGVFTKIGTDSQCTIRMGFSDALEEISFAEYVQNNISQNELFISTFKQEHPEYTATMDTKGVNFADGKTIGNANIYKIADADGKVVHYAVMIYYPYNGQAYYINYACANGTGYDEEFDFVSYIEQNYVIK